MRLLAIVLLCAAMVWGLHELLVATLDQRLVLDFGRYPPR